jgi:hypothetical protein
MNSCYYDSDDESDNLCSPSIKFPKLGKMNLSQIMRILYPNLTKYKNNSCEANGRYNKKSKELLKDINIGIVTEKDIKNAIKEDSEQTEFNDMIHEINDIYYKYKQLKKNNKSKVNGMIPELTDVCNKYGHLGKNGEKINSDKNEQKISNGNNKNFQKIGNDKNKQKINNEQKFNDIIKKNDDMFEFIKPEQKDDDMFEFIKPEQKDDDMFEFIKFEEYKEKAFEDEVEEKKNIKIQEPFKSDIRSDFQF